MKRISLVFIIIILFIIFIPFIPLLLSSIDNTWKMNSFLPQHINADTWIKLFRETPNIFSTISTSIFIALIVTLLNLFVALPAAHAITRYNFKSKKIISLLLLSPLLVPAYVPLMGIHGTFITLGLADSITGVILAHMIPSLPYMIRALVISYETIGTEKEEQGRILGARSHEVFYHITLPSLIPGIIAGSTITILVSLSQYISTLIIGGGLIKTITILMFPFFQGSYFSMASVLVLVLVLVTLFLLIIVDKIQRRYSTVNTLPQV